MAILKIIADDSDIDGRNAPRSFDTTYIDTSRVEYGWILDTGDNLQCSWPEPVGNTVWMHFRFGQDSNSSAWDNLAIEFLDAAGSNVLDMWITDAVHRWFLIGDTTVSANYSAVVGTARTYDVAFTKNGTTDITVSVYSNGTLLGTLTRPNSGDRGVPVSMRLESTDPSNSGNMWFSEMIVADEDTRGWRLRQHKPISFGGDNAWDNDALAMTLDTLETGLVSNTLNQRTSFGLSNQPVPVGVVVDRVVIQTYAQRGSSGLASFNHYFKYSAGPTDVDGADIALIENLNMYIDEYPTSPNTGVAWTDAELTDIQFGIRART